MMNPIIILWLLRFAQKVQGCGRNSFPFVDILEVPEQSVKWRKSQLALVEIVRGKGILAWNKNGQDMSSD